MRYKYVKHLTPELDKIDITVRDSAYINIALPQIDINRKLINELIRKYPGVKNIIENCELTKFDTVLSNNIQNCPAHLVNDKITRFNDMKNAFLKSREYSMKYDLQSETICVLHSMLYNNDPEISQVSKLAMGRYRNSSDSPIIANYIADIVQPRDILHKMNDSFYKYKNDWDHHPILSSSIMHTEIVRIQPFLDGNKKAGQIAQNFCLTMCGYPDMVLPDSKLDKYQSAIKIGILNRDATPLAEFACANILEDQTNQLGSIKNYLMEQGLSDPVVIAQIDKSNSIIDSQPTHTILTETESMDEEERSSTLSVLTRQLSELIEKGSNSGGSLKDEIPTELLDIEYNSNEIDT